MHLPRSRVSELSYDPQAYLDPTAKSILELTLGGFVGFIHSAKGSCQLLSCQGVVGMACKLTIASLRCYD